MTESNGRQVNAILHFTDLCTAPSEWRRIVAIHKWTQIVMQASTSQVESYADFNISHPVPDFKAVRSLNIPNYEFLNKPRPLQRCESLRRIVQL